MSRCMTFAALLFDPHRTPSRVSVHRDDSGRIAWIDEANDITPAQMHRAGWLL